MKAPGNEQTVVIDLDKAIVVIVKNGKHYSLDGYLNERFEAFLAMRLREEFDGRQRPMGRLG